jgi:hypothetical protein
MAAIAIATRLSTPSLFLMCATCVLAVFSEVEQRRGTLSARRGPLERDDNFRTTCGRA